MTAALQQEVRQRILDTAYDLLSEHGVAHLTQPRVSRAAGVRQGHLTYYFPRRSDLLVALARHSMEILAGPLVSQANSGALGPADFRSAIIHALSDRRRVRAVLGLIAAADEDPAVREALRDLVKRVRAQLAQVFASLGLPADPETVALVHTFIVGAGVLSHARADDEARREAHAVVGHLMGLLPRMRPVRKRASRSRRLPGGTAS
jgi:AcrR family transcriptional regulator